MQAAAGRRYRKALLLPRVMLESDPPGVLHFDRYTLRLRDRKLLQGEQSLPIGSRAFDLLHLLARRAGETVSTDELRRAAWPDREVGDNNLRVQLLSLRKLLGEQAIVNQPGQGYRFTLPLRDDHSTQAGFDPAATPGNLPGHLPPLIGREAERQRVQQLLDSHARVTLLGAAGIGKTALAQECAFEQRGRYADGVWWVELAALTEAVQLGTAVATALGLLLRDTREVVDLARSLADRHMLLVLDNCEHVIAPVTDLADALLQVAPGVRVLATSRRLLKCAGEQPLRLEPLPLPAVAGLAAARRSPAVVLFETRARRADPRFAITEANAEAVVAICRQLDGIALAIALAASRVPLLGVAGLHDRLGDRLRLLRNREPESEHRHSTLQTALDWSHALLTGAERTVLGRLAVFAGSFALDAVQAVAGDDTLDDWAVLDALQELIDQSLLNPDEATLHGSEAARYRLHETVRLYAQAQLAAGDEEQALRRRHARYMLNLVRGQVGEDGEPLEPMDTRLPDADLDNLRAALSWSLDQDIELALQLAIHANAFFRLRGHHAESRRIAARVLAHEHVGQHPLLRVRLRLAQCSICFEQNDLSALSIEVDEAMREVQQAQGPDVTFMEGLAWAWRGTLQLVLRNLDQAELSLQRALALYRATAHVREIATALNNLACNCIERGQPDAAQPLLEEALQLNRQLGSQWGGGVTLENMGEMAYAQGRYELARKHWLQAQSEFRALRHVYHDALISVFLGLAAWRMGQAEQAHEHLMHGLGISLAKRFPVLVADALAVLAALALEEGRVQRAAVLLRLAHAHRPHEQVSGPMRGGLQDIAAAVQQAAPAALLAQAEAEAEHLLQHASEHRLLAYAAA